MELIIDFIIGAISSVCIGLITNYIYDKIKNHSSSANRKSGLEFEFKVKFKFSKKQSILETTTLSHQIVVSFLI